MTKLQKIRTKLNKLYPLYASLNQNKQDQEKLGELITKISKLEAKLIKNLKIKYKINSKIRK